MTTACADTSVVVAALSTWHVAHEPARASVDEHRPLLPAHVLLESYATLTRLPGRALPPAIVLDALRSSFPDRYPASRAGAYPALLRQLSVAGLAGGAVYDGLVAAASKAANARLFTLDKRAVPVYELMGCAYELVASS